MSKKYTIEEARKIFDECGYDLIDTEYINAFTKMTYTCRKHPQAGVQYVRLASLNHNKSACKMCRYEKSGKANRGDFQRVKQAFEESDKILLDGEDAYKNAYTQLRYLCPHHLDKGVMTMCYHDVTKGAGCYYCYKEKQSQTMTLDYEFIKSQFEDAGLILLDIEYINSKIPMKYICPKHPNIVQQISYSALHQGQGCKYCNESKGEAKVDAFLCKSNIKYSREQTFVDCVDIGRLRFDFYLSDKNIAIEYDGIQHFKPTCFGSMSMDDAELVFKDTQRRDAIKTQYCKDHDIKLIRIPYWDKDNIEQILKKELNIY